MTTDKQTDIPPKLPTEMPTEKSSNNSPKLSFKWLAPRRIALRPYCVPNQEMARSENPIHQAAVLEQKRSDYMVSMTDCDAYVLDIDQCQAAHTRFSWR